MSRREAQDSNEGMEPTMEPVAGELTAELSRSAENALPPALARRLVELGESEVARRKLMPRALRPIRTGTMRAGWALAAAAVIAWLVVPSPFVAGERGAGIEPTQDETAALLADTAALRVPWVASTDPAATTATGEVIWDAARQRGVLRIRGLVPNDPKLAQYQLWIIDADRDARYPVDGGVFDVMSAGEVLVPVTARLRVGRPTLFAITLEQPGGVVVSSRERLVLAAPVSG
jgi:anti-sigma-K factor RskA